LQYKEDKRAIEYVKNIAEFFPLADGSKISASQFMEKFGFTAQQQFTPLSKLSGGEKRRLHLLSILFKNPNFLVLDEPTNDLDLQTLRTLEEFLQDFPGCILIVSHDRYFMDRLVDHLFAFEGNGEIRDFPGNYSQYRLAKQLEENAEGKKQNAQGVTQKAEGQGQNAGSKTQNMHGNEQQKLSFKEKTEFEKLEKELADLEKEKKLLEVKLNNGSMEFEQLQKTSERISEIIVLVDKKEMRWLELSERM
jgi:ATP-binding cassette subfamily F protein uup